MCSGGLGTGRNLPNAAEVWPGDSWGNARLAPGFSRWSGLLETGREVFGLEKAWDGETRPCRSGNCAPTSLTLRGTQMDLGPPGSLRIRDRRAHNWVMSGVAATGILGASAHGSSI